MKRCVKCVLPASTPGITFSEEGVCNYCLSHREHSPPGIEPLLRIMDESRLPGSFEETGK